MIDDRSGLVRRRGAQGLGQRPGAGRGPARRLGAGEQRYLAPAVRVAACQVGELVGKLVVGQVAGGEVFLKGAVR
jgi:hypothetical protein